MSEDLRLKGFPPGVLRPCESRRNPLDAGGTEPIEMVVFEGAIGRFTAKIMTIILPIDRKVIDDTISMSHLYNAF